MSDCHPVDRYQPGGAWAVCDRCNFQRRHRTLRREYSGFLVCETCFDPRPEDLSRPRVGPEGLPVRDARPDHLDILGPNETTAADL